ncbi:hypothetical protein PoB_002928500 [Plakobranchus ocellatus]|uniref:Uncharacterized protein n=1 Tax=Plakobranchus ocellatus TaxID=259542 RepID=A0AAV4A5X6_9GAST|nr:hypothetical protein PoB_002928500 [Plakobranchus ocellatus]
MSTKALVSTARVVPQCTGGCNKEPSSGLKIDSQTIAPKKRRQDSVNIIILIHLLVRRCCPAFACEPGEAARRRRDGTGRSTDEARRNSIMQISFPMRRL